MSSPDKQYFECTAVDFDGSNTATLTSTTFTNRNPDFADCANGMLTGLQEGVLGPLGTALGPNGLPILLNPNQLSGFSTQANFEQWWLGPSVGVTNAGCLGPTSVLLELTKTQAVGKNPPKWAHKVSGAFHPLKNFGFSDPNKGNTNAGFFALMCQSEFVYKQGQKSFSFKGDDDVWIYINRKLVADIGGIHGAVSRNVNLEKLNLIDGCRYPIHLFQADRCCCTS